MLIYYPDVPDLPLPAGHRFPARKYRLLRERIVDHNILDDWKLAPSPPASLGELQRAHSAAYVQAVLEGTLARRTFSAASACPGATSWRCARGRR